MIYRRYLNELRSDLKAAKGMLDSALDNRPTVSDACNEAHWDNLLVEWQNVVDNRKADVAILDAMLEAVSTQEVMQGLQ